MPNVPTLAAVFRSSPSRWGLRGDVKGLDHGGMSGGMVTTAWWLGTALPLLRERLAAAAKPAT
jgi:hypothetical protein